MSCLIQKRVIGTKYNCNRVKNMCGIIIVAFCVIPLVKSQWVIDDQGCITPNSAVGNCIPVKECPAILDIIVQSDSLPYWMAKEINLYQCGFTENSVKVCCPYDASNLNYLTNDNELETDIINHENLNMLPEECGLPYDDNKIIQGDITRVFQFPWMALLSYKKGNEIDFKCAGTVINDWYILTAAHCLTNIGNLKLIGVRAGEHNITSPIDCNKMYNGQLECAEKVQDVAVDGIILHPGYNSQTFENDIGLIRLAWSLNTSTDSVKPICLPTTKEFTNLNLTNTKLTVTGWGWTEKGKKSDVLLKADVTVLSNEKCRDIYKPTKIHINENQLCASDPMKDSCEGDSGGPLQTLYYYNNDVRYIQQGIISFGPSLCGKTYPGVYTRIDRYMEWILDSLY